MAYTKGIIIRLKAVGKPRNAPLLAQGMESFPASRENLVGVGLMAYIPNQFVLGKIKYTVERQRQFYGSQARCQVSPVFSHRLYDKGPQFLSQPFQFCYTVSLDICCFLDFFQ